MMKREVFFWRYCQTGMPLPTLAIRMPPPGEKRCKRTGCALLSSESGPALFLRAATPTSLAHPHIRRKFCAAAAAAVCPQRGAQEGAPARVAAAAAVLVGMASATVT